MSRLQYAKCDVQSSSRPPTTSHQSIPISLSKLKTRNVVSKMRKPVVREAASKATPAVDSKSVLTTTSVRCVQSTGSRTSVSVSRVSGESQSNDVGVVYGRQRPSGTTMTTGKNWNTSVATSRNYMACSRFVRTNESPKRRLPGTCTDSTRRLSDVAIEEHQSRDSNTTMTSRQSTVT